MQFICLCVGDPGSGGSIGLCQRRMTWRFFRRKVSTLRIMEKFVFITCQGSKIFLRPGWKPAGERKFFTFTTAQPSKKPRFKPAGLEKATDKDLSLWAADRHRFPPYAYSHENGVCHPKKGWRMLDICEKELIMGMPMNYTEQCKPKGFRKTSPLETNDTRMSLVGNAWHIAVVANLLQPLMEHLNLCSPRSVGDIMQLLKPGGAKQVASKLLRPGFSQQLPFHQVPQSEKDQQTLVHKLCHLVSAKGTDVLLTSSSELIPKNHRLRNSLIPKLWRWTFVDGNGSALMTPLQNTSTS